MGACTEPGCTADAVEGSTRCCEHRDLIDTEVMALGDPPRGEAEDYDDYDDPEFDDEDDEFPMDCHMHHDGQCGAAGSEWCEFECPVMAEWRREPWDENGPISDKPDTASVIAGEDKP